jgi:hypothetical protein
MRLLLRAAGEQEEFRRVFAFRAQGRLALRSHVQNSLLFGTWLLSGSRALSIRGEKLANVLLLACCYQEVSELFVLKAAAAFAPFQLPPGDKLDDRSANNYTMNISSILYFQRKTSGSALISSKY